MTTSSSTPADTAAPIRILRGLGFTEYEAEAYVTLVERGELNGYGVAKWSGIPRANVYGVMGKLVERGAASRIRRGKNHLYLAVPPSQLLEDVRTRHAKVIDEATDVLSRLKAPEVTATPVFNLHGADLMRRAAELIAATRQHLDVALQPPEAGQLAAALARASERGVEIVTLCLQDCVAPCGGCAGEIHRRALPPSDGSRWLLLIADGAEALVGRFSPAGSEGLVTTQKLVAELVGSFIQHGIEDGGARAGADPAVACSHEAYRT